MHNLPDRINTFVGREGEFSQIAKELEDANCRLITLVGPGGIGKTQLAIEVARQQSNHFSDGVFLILTEDLTSPEQLVLSVGTVKWYLNQLYGKLIVRNRTQAVARARELTLID